MTLAAEASAVVAALVETGPASTWAEGLLTSRLVAPQLLHVEVANVLRRAAGTGAIIDDIASLAHADLVDLRVELVPNEPVAARVWALRHDLTAYDAWYVAVAELIDAPLATLDERLAAAPGPRCAFQTPTDAAGRQD